MKSYIAVKMVDGEPMTKGEFSIKRGFTNHPWDVNSMEEGYLVVYPDGYQSWSPKEAFELSHLEHTL